MIKRRRRTNGGCVVVAVLFCAATLCAGQDAPSVHELATRVDRHYDQLKSLKAGFTEGYAGLGMTRTESGTLFLRKPGRMMWQYTLRRGRSSCWTGNTRGSDARGDAQVQRIPASELDDLRSPLRFLLGHTQLEKELTGLKLAAAANGSFTLTGLPKGQEKRVTRLSLTVTAEGAITAIEVEEADGAITRFTFTGEQPNAEVPAAVFHFTPPSGVPVADAPPPV